METQTEKTLEHDMGTGALYGKTDFRWNPEVRFVELSQQETRESPTASHRTQGLGLGWG